MQDGKILEQASWAMCALTGAVLAGWVLVTDFVIDPLSALGPFSVVAGLSGLIHFYTRYRPDARIASTLTALVQLIVFTGLGAPLSYCVASLALPFWDETLRHWDLMLGLDWRACLDWVNARPIFGSALSFAYASIMPQMIIITAALGLSGHTRELRLFVTAVTLSGLITVLISGAMPAMAYFVHLGLTPADYPNLSPGADFVHKGAMEGLRDGSFRILALDEGEGIITFPSYHAALAVIFAAALWKLRWLRWPGLALNMLMIVATPIDGGHYFVDVFAGIAIAILVIVLSEQAAAWSGVGLPRLRLPWPGRQRSTALGSIAQPWQ